MTETPSTTETTILDPNKVLPCGHTYVDHLLKHVEQVVQSAPDDLPGEGLFLSVTAFVGLISNTEMSPEAGNVMVDTFVAAARKAMPEATDAELLRFLAESAIEGAALRQA